jgi:hypothetical protein
MPINIHRQLSLGFGLLFAIGAALTLFVMFKAGCAGDLKGGALGDPIRALQYERYSVFSLIVSAASGGATVALMSKSTHRIAHSLAFATATLICLWLAGIQFEIWGVQSCF